MSEIFLSAPTALFYCTFLYFFTALYCTLLHFYPDNPSLLLHFTAPCCTLLHFAALLHHFYITYDCHFQFTAPFSYTSLHFTALHCTFLLHLFAAVCCTSLHFTVPRTLLYLFTALHCPFQNIIFQIYLFPNQIGGLFEIAPQ